MPGEERRPLTSGGGRALDGRVACLRNSAALMPPAPPPPLPLQVLMLLHELWLLIDRDIEKIHLNFNLRARFSIKPPSRGPPGSLLRSEDLEIFKMDTVSKGSEAGCHLGTPIT